MKIELNSLEDTRALAIAAADACKGRTLTITLDGDLGAGKTAWTRFFGQALGVRRTINSPTFTILKSYRQADGKPLHHIDAYRLEGAHQDLGFEDCFDDGLCVVEWAQYIEDEIPEDHLSFSFKETGETSRELSARACGKQSAQVLEAIRQAMESGDKQ